MDYKVPLVDIKKLVKDAHLKNIDAKAIEKLRDVYANLALKLIRECILVAEESKSSHIVDKHICSAFVRLFGQKLFQDFSIQDKKKIHDVQFTKMIKSALKTYTSEHLKVKKAEQIMLQICTEYLLKVGFLEPLKLWKESGKDKIKVSDLFNLNIVYTCTQSEFGSPSISG